jgi:hypothetical protein
MEAQKSEHRWRHEEEAELLRKKEAKEEFRKVESAKHSIIGNKVVVAFTIILRV